MAASPGYHCPWVKGLEEDEDTAVLCVVQDQAPVQFTQSIVLPAVARIKNLKKKMVMVKFLYLICMII